MYFAYVFDGYEGEICSWRWNSIVQSLDETVPTEEALVNYFSLARYNGAAQAPDSEDANISNERPDTAVRAADAYGAVVSRFYWQYAKMMQLLASVLLWFHSWSLTCPCHPMKSVFELGRISVKKMSQN